MEWSQRRKITYALATAGALILVASYPAYRLFYTAPTCFDQKQNGDELGVDCGGSQCALYCPAQVKAPRVLWVKAFRVSPGRYDVGAYVENPNISAGVKNARYLIHVLDETGQTIAERAGSIELDPASTELIFEGGFALTVTPGKVEIEFNKYDIAHFVKARPTPLIVMSKNQSLKNSDTVPRFDATLVNTDLVNDVGRVELGAIIYDPARNPIAISRSYVDTIAKGTEQPIFFTWPNRFTKNPRGAICITPVDTMLVFDRSGSMDAGRRNPPEPLTTAKKAASAYVEAADLLDKVGLVSFATTVSNPIDHELSVDHTKVIDAVTNIAIRKGSLQYTNLGDAIKDAFLELVSTRHTNSAKQVIVALTDGVANRPLDPANPKNTSYAGEYAARQANIARVAGIDIYAVGLGKDLSLPFLRDRIATDPAHFFNAPTANDLQAIYKNIAESVCKEGNFLTEIVITPHAVFAE